MSVSDVLHWLIDHSTRDGSTAPEKVAELHTLVDTDEPSGPNPVLDEDDAAGQVDEPATPSEPAPPAPEPTPEPAPEPPAEVTPDAPAQ